MTFFWRYGIVLAILGAGFALRMLNLTAQPLWVDEGFTAFLTQQADVFAVLKTDVHPPVYFLAITAWAQVAGISELSLRFFSVLGGMVSLALVYRLARDTAPRDARASYALLALGLLALADMELYTAQEARAYSWHVALGLAAVWSLVRWGQTGKTRYAVGIAFFNALLVYTHYLGAWLGVAQGLYALLAWRGRVRIWAVGALCASAGAVLVWGVAVILPYQLQTIGAHTRTDPSTWQTLQNYLGAFFSQQWVLLVGVAMVGVGAGGRYRFRALWVLWLVLPVALTFMANAPSGRLLFDYRLSQITPSVALLVALGLMQFSARVRWFLVAVIAINGLLHTDVGRTKEDWRGLGQAVARAVYADEAVLVDFGGGDFQMTYYLDRFLPASVPSYSLRQAQQHTPATYEADALSFMGAHDALWLVRWNDTNEAFAKLAFTGHVRTVAIPLATDNGMDVWLYRYDRISNEPLGTFDNGMILYAARADAKGVRLWWASDVPLDADYSTSVKFLGADGAVLAEYDSTLATRTWQVDGVYYDEKPLPLMDNVRQVVVLVYVASADGFYNVLYEKTNNWAVIGQLSR